MRPPQCDFCNSLAVAWAYPTRDLSSTIPVPGKNATVTINSRGGWAACTPCHDLIEAGNRDGLAVRSAKAGNRRGVPLHLIVAACRKVHDDFWANREGPPIPASPSEADPTR